MTDKNKNRSIFKNSSKIIKKILDNRIKLKENNKKGVN